jgi:hypothetical protein
VIRKVLDHTATVEAGLLDDGVGLCQLATNLDKCSLGNTFVQSTARRASGVIPSAN